MEFDGNVQKTVLNIMQYENLHNINSNKICKKK